MLHVRNGREEKVAELPRAHKHPPELCFPGENAEVSEPQWLFQKHPVLESPADPGPSECRPMGEWLPVDVPGKVSHVVFLWSLWLDKHLCFHDAVQCRGIKRICPP